MNIDIWNRLTDVRGEGRWRELKEIRRRMDMLICVAHGHSQPWGRSRDKGCVEGAKGRKQGISVIASTTKIKLQ